MRLASVEVPSTPNAWPSSFEACSDDPSSAKMCAQKGFTHPSKKHFNLTHSFVCILLTKRVQISLRREGEVGEA